jgi:hypothetical protein|tara:strand:- start:11476 stop:12573 length:1098 start_codon:yes stop_codon:yes gene_type:complete
MAIQIKRSETNSSTSLPGTLLSGEMAVVQALKKVYIGRHNNSAVEVFHLSTLNDLTGGNGITATLASGAGDNAMSLSVDVADSNIFGTTSAKGLLQADSDVFQVTAGVVDIKADGIDETHIDFGTSSGQVSSADVPEQTNLYHTTARARASVSATDSGGDGSFSYNSTSGVLTYTGPSAAEVRTHFSNGTGVTITNGSVAIGQSVATDQSPAFAGLDIGGSMTITGNITGDSGNMTVSASGGDVLVEATTFSGNDVVIPGNLTVNGATTTVKSNTVIIDDPIFQLGAVSGAAPSSDDNKDRGVMAHYYSGSAKQAFFGLDDSSGRFTFIPDATESTGVISGSLGHAEFGEVTATTFHGTIDGGSF